MNENTGLPNPNFNVPRDLSVGRNATIGGDSAVRGNMIVEHGLRVKGWFSVDNVNFPTFGVFESQSDLESATGQPKDGWIAGVLEESASSPSGYKVVLWVYKNGAWAESNPKRYVEMRVVWGINSTIEGIDAEQFAEWQEDVNEDLLAKAVKEEMLITPGTGADADKTTIQLKDGVLATVLVAHQDVSDKADRVSDATPFNIARLDSAGNIKDSGKSIDLLDALGVASGYFAGNVPPSATIVNQKFPGNVNLETLKDTIFYDESSRRFLYLDTLSGSYYTRWKGDEAYMVSGAIRTNKLYILYKNGEAILYYAFENNNEIILNAVGVLALRDKANKNELTVTPGTGADADKTTIQLKSGVYATVLVSHQDVSDKADKDEMSVDDSDGFVTVTLKGTGINATKAVVYSPNKVDQLLGRSIGEAVKCTFAFDQEGDYTICNSRDVLLASVEGVGVIPNDGEGITIHVDNAVTLEAKFVFKDSSLIPQGAFQNIDNITAVHLPSFIRVIEAYAFGNSKSIEVIDCESITPPTATLAFDGVDMGNVALTVHAAASTYYEDGGSNWCGVGEIETY